MKKKLTVLMMFLVVVMTGCGGGIDYTDSTIYYDAVISKINEIEPDYITNYNAVIEDIGVTNEFKTLKDTILNSYSIILDKVPSDQIETVYNDTMGYIDEAKDLSDLGIDISVSELEDAKTQIDELGEDAKGIATSYFQMILTTANDVLKAVNNEIEGMTLEELDSYYGLGDVINEYIEENNITDQFEEQLAELKKQAEELIA